VADTHCLHSHHDHLQKQFDCVEEFNHSQHRCVCPDSVLHFSYPQRNFRRCLRSFFYRLRTFRSTSYLHAILYSCRHYSGIIRWKEIPTSEKEASIYSREFWIFLGATTLCLMGFQVLLPTSIPVYNSFIELFGGESNLAPPADQIGFYSRFQLWFGVLVALISGTGQFFWWKRMEKEKLIKEIIPTYLNFIGRICDYYPDRKSVRALLPRAYAGRGIPDRIQPESTCFGNKSKCFPIWWRSWHTLAWA
jgi:hypothetical protein